MQFCMESPLRQIRKLFGASQADMARIAGVDQSTWSRWERGIRHPDLPALKRIRTEARRRRVKWTDRLIFEAAA
jgi:transcriptional regulator with XRE-family HTH domain